MINRQIKKLYGARNSLKFKLFSGFIGLSLILSFSLGFTLYKVSNSIFYKSFLQHKKSLGISISSGIDGKIFKSFTNEASINLPEFNRYLQYLRSISENEEYITWIYSVLLDKKSKNLIYAIDATPILEDTIWIENEYLGLRVYINRKGKFSVFWDSKEYNEDFTINYKDKIFKITIDTKNNILQINDSFRAKLQNVSPFTIETKEGIVDAKNPSLISNIQLGDTLIPVSLKFASKNSPSSMPGWDFIESEKLTNKIKTSINTCTFHMQNEPEQVAYGTFIMVIAPIYGNPSECIGAVLFSVSTSDIKEFKSSMAITGITITLVLLCFSVIFSYMLSTYFTDPVRQLSKAVDELSSGNMETNVVIHSKDEFGFLSTKFNEMVINLKKAYKEKESLAALQHELEVAKKIQTSILPKSIPALTNLDIAVNYFPMAQVGGDFYDFHVVDENKIGIFIADVSGHGIPAAIIASMLKIAFSIQSAFADDPARLLSRINKSMLHNVGNNFITGSYIFLDLEIGLMTHAKAGHPTMYIYSPDTDKVKEYEQKGRILGSFPEINAETTEIPIKKGDRIVLYTDGIIEARNSKDEMFGEELFIGYIKKHNKMRPTDFAKLVMNDVKSWIGNTNASHYDDITLIIVDIK